MTAETASPLSTEDLLERAERWLQHDPDPNARAQLRKILDQARSTQPSNEAQAAAIAELADRFSGPLVFGTAGLRGVIGAGESRMNRAVVIRTTAGLAAFLSEALGDEARRRGVVVGHDARLMSREFAEDTASVLAAAGIPAHLFSGVGPTPLAAFAVRHLGAAAGAMVTASHNPPEYNGYKAYWQNGAQIVPPIDEGIARAIDASPPADSVPRMPLDEARRAGLVRELGAELEDAYVERVLALSRPGGDRSIPIAYTPLHGVGHALARRVLERAGFSRIFTVPEQAEPDGGFPTVAFPNPEEKGALDLAYALAEKEGADLVIANDPDADRLAVAVRHESGFVQLTGNQVGVLLGHHLLETGGSDAPGRLVVTTVVSSPMLGEIARSFGARYAETLTGFKWIANRAMELEAAEGLRFVFGYEEALGYAVGDAVRDKDGISAALVLAELAAARRAEGKTLLDELEALARRYGLYASAQRSITMPGANGVARIAELMGALRRAAPASIGGLPVLATLDYAARERRPACGQAEPLDLPASDVLAFELEGKSRVIARPSGTEPKIKFYIDVREPVAEGEPLPSAEARAHLAIDRLLADVLALAGVA